MDQVPDDIKTAIEALGGKADKEKVMEIIVSLCKWKELKSTELAEILGKSEKYVLRKFVGPLRIEGKIAYTIPDMVNHPEQAYKTPK